MEYLRSAIMKQKEAKVIQANADLDCNRKAFFELLCRPTLNKSYGAFLIANVPVDTPDELLYGNKKDLLSRARRFIEESKVEKQTPVEWLRWAIEHNELLLEMQQDKDRITQVLLAFDRNREQDSLAARASPQNGEAKPTVSPSCAGPTHLPPQHAPTSVVFPYATKQLKAMRAAVAEYWEGYTSDKCQPTQKAIAYTLGEKLNLPRQGSGEPARKAMILASAIKPDTLPDL